MLSIQGSPYALFLFDSVYMYAVIADQMLKEGTSPRNGSRMFEMSKNVTFEGNWLELYSYSLGSMRNSSAYSTSLFL